MFIFYNKVSGGVAFTMNGASYPPHLVTDDVGLISTDTDIQDLSCYRVIDGELVQFTIEPVRHEAMRKLNSKMADMRSSLITPLPGQDMIYLRKQEEAKSYLNSVDPVLEDYPLIAAELGVTGENAYQIAQIWMAMADLWVNAAAGLEGLRMRVGNLISNAETESDIEAALALLD